MAAKQKRVRTRDVVAEGLYIASAATRLRLKNSILVHILAEGENFQPQHFMADAREALLVLAAEAEADAARAETERKTARHLHTDSDGTHDYRRRDARNLLRRAKQSLHVAHELRARADDDTELLKLVGDARDAAWTEVARNIDQTLRIVAARPDLEPDYERMRSARMQALALVDLPKLRAHRRSVAVQQRQAAAGIAPPEVIRTERAAFDPGELE